MKIPVHQYLCEKSFILPYCLKTKYGPSSRSSLHALNGLPTSWQIQRTIWPESFLLCCTQEISGSVLDFFISVFQEHFHCVLCLMNGLYKFPISQSLIEPQTMHFNTRPAVSLNRIPSVLYGHCRMLVYYYSEYSNFSVRPLFKLSAQFEPTTLVILFVFLDRIERAWKLSRAQRYLYPAFASQNLIFVHFYRFDRQLSSNIKVHCGCCPQTSCKVRVQDFIHCTLNVGKSIATTLTSDFATSKMNLNW